MYNNIFNQRPLVIATIVAIFMVGCQPSSEHTEDVTSQTETVDVNAQFEAYSEQFLDTFWSHFPGWATYVGYYKYDDLLPVPSAENIAQLRQFAKQSLAKLSEFEQQQLSVSNATDLALIKNQLNSRLWYLDVFRQHHWDPSQYNVANIFGLILNTDYEPIDDRLRTITARLENVPAYYAAAKANIKQPTAEHTLLAIEQNEGALAVFESLVPEQIATSGLSTAERDLLQARLDQAATAIRRYIEYLQALQNRTQPSWRSFRIGADLYEQKFKYDIVSDLSAEQLYQKAVAEKSRLHQRMFKITEQLWPDHFPGTEPPENSLLAIKQMIDVLSVRHVERENFVAEIRRQMPIIQKFMDDNELLDSDPSRPLVVREAPAYQRGIAGASVDAPGPYDATANTYYNVTPLDDMSEEQAASWLREYNHWILQILNIHEATPGHYTQLMHANKSPSVVKAVFGNGAMIEGWAVYSELMMMEAGYGNNEPEMWLMYSKWNLRAVINTILDYQVHVLGMEKDAAIEMLVNEGFQEQAEAQGKWRRVTLSQVQLTSYYNGYAEILAFREELKAKLGNEFDLRTFHNKFLSYGNSPVPVIRKLMLQEWGLNEDATSKEGDAS